MLKDKVVLLTGASGGFGQQFVRQLCAKGCRLILTDLDEVKMEEVADSIPAGSPGTILATIPVDLSHHDGSDELFAAVNKLDIAVDILINNAGIATVGRHDEVPPDAWERLLHLNLLTPMHLTALLTPQMIERRSGHIVNICSLASYVVDQAMSYYAASKFGLRGYTIGINAELKPHNVSVSAIYPWFSDTPILRSPQFGSYATTGMLDAVNIPMVTDPVDVIANAINGIESKKLHIFPDRIGRFVYRAQRFFPPLFNLLVRNMNRSRQ